MSKTYVAFYYGQNVDQTNFAIDFNEGGAELQASIPVADYTLTELMAAVESALNQTGTEIYSVSVDRDTRRVTISATGNFSLLVATGTRSGVHAFDLLGFTGVTDLTGATTYTSVSASGSEYVSQFWPQDFMPAANNRQFIDPTVNESASGEIEVIKFGERRFIEMNIRFATDIEQPFWGPIRNNPTGVEDLISFLEYATTKAKFEFMLDSEDRNVFENVLLEATPQDSTGTAFELSELYGQGLYGYYETGIIRLRKVS